MPAAELAAPRPVFPGMTSFAPLRRSRSDTSSPWRVRPALLAALAISLLLHLAWSMWPVAPSVVDESPVLTVTLTEMPPPPAPPPAPASVVARAAPTPPPRRQARAASPLPIIAAPGSSVTVAPDASPAEVPTTDSRSVATAAADGTSTAAEANAEIGALQTPAAPPVVLPPRLDLGYKVFFGTRGFMIGDATYRFEHTGDRYRISTVGQARGLAALIVHGTGKIESRGRITPNGLKPYEFAIERGSADKREVAYFDWDAGNVVLHDGAIAPLEAPAFDPLTILWQSYFSPPSRDAQTFSLATTRRVARYTATLEGEETIAWRQGSVQTQRWHRASDDGKTEAWFWLAPSLHYIPVKMRITRTSRGTLEALLDSIRTDASAASDAGAERARPDDSAPFPPWNPMAPVPGPDAHGQ